MIYKTCHAARTYLVVDGETHLIAAGGLQLPLSVPRKLSWNQLPPLFAACYIEASNENVNDAPGKWVSRNMLQRDG